MAAMDEFREQREAIKDKPFKYRFAYYWGYYKWYVFGGILAVIFLGSLLNSILNNKPDALFGVVLNGIPYNDEEVFIQDFADYAGIDTDKETVSLNSTLRMSDQIDENSISASEFLMVYTAAKDLDVCVMDKARFDKYSYGGTYLDLRTCLTEEELEQYADRIYYMDYTFYQEFEKLQDENAVPDDLEFPNAFDPDSMDDPIPVGIDISDCTRLTDVYYYEDGECYLGIMVNTERVENAVKFLHYVLEE